MWHADFACRGEVDAEDWLELEAWADVIVFQGFLLHEVPMLLGSSKVIVVDLYDPFHLEQLELSRHDPFDRRVLEVGESVRVLNQQIRRGDFFLSASEKQRDFWLGQLSAMQRVNPYVYDDDESLHGLLDVVPFGVPDEPPERTGAGIRGVVPGIGADDKVLIWGGGIYNWFDPITLIRAVDKLRLRVPNVRLYFMGTRHPNPDVPEMRVAWDARQVATDLGLLDTHVFFNDGWVPYEDRQNHLFDADVGVTTHLDHVETEFSFRTRVLDYFWTSLPVVTTAGDPLAALVESRGLGLTVPAEDVDALEDALFRMLTDEQFIAECRKNVDEVAEEFRWSRVLQPLAEFCRRPERAPDSFALQQPMRESGASGLVHELTLKLQRKMLAARAARAEGGYMLLARRSARLGQAHESALESARAASRRASRVDLSSHLPVAPELGVQHRVQLDVESLAFTLGEDHSRPKSSSSSRIDRSAARLFTRVWRCAASRATPPGGNRNAPLPRPSRTASRSSSASRTRCSSTATCASPTPRRLHISTARARNTDGAAGPSAGLEPQPQGADGRGRDGVGRQRGPAQHV